MATSDTRVVIEIENGLVTKKTYTASTPIALDAFLPLIENRPAIYSPVLPTNTRAEYWDSSDPSEQKLSFLMEREPQIIHMQFRNSSHVIEHHDLSIPWTRFVFYATTTDPNAMGTTWRLNDYKVFWSKRKFDSISTRDMLPALLPNIYEDGRICFGSTAANMNQSFADRMDETVNSFYLSQFNRDLTIRYPNEARNWRAWETMTTRTPMGWMNWSDWSNRDMTSWEDVARTPSDRTERIVGADGIPPLAIGATWGAAEEWWNSLTNNQRARLANIASTTSPDLLTPLATTEETEDNE